MQRHGESTRHREEHRVAPRVFERCRASGRIGRGVGVIAMKTQAGVLRVDGLDPHQAALAGCLHALVTPASDVRVLAAGTLGQRCLAPAYPVIPPRVVTSSGGGTGQSG